MDRVVEIEAPKVTGLRADLNRVRLEIELGMREINLTGDNKSAKSHIQIAIHILNSALENL